MANKTQKFMLFCLMGAVSSLIDIALLTIGVEIFGLELLIAATLSFGIASINGYLLNRKFTFAHGDRATFSQYLKFLAVSIVGLCLTLVLLHVFTTLLGLHYLVAKILTIILVVAWNYVANVMWTFKSA